MTIIDKLTQLLQQRRDASPNDSYVASLYQSGLNKILEKLGEEVTETLLAAKDAAGTQNESPSATRDATRSAGLTENPKNDALIGEVADLWFHSLVMLVYLDQEPRWVLEELERRFGTSGLVEKAARGEPNAP